MYVYCIFNIIFMHEGGITVKPTVQNSRDILIYNSSQDKWTKTGELCRARAYHAMSLVPAVVEDECIVDIDCFAD